MPIPYAVARLNRRVTNRLMAVPAPWVPPLAVLHHRGRQSSHRYATPVIAFRTPGGFVVALTYGPAVDWLRNLSAAGEGRLVRRGAVHVLGVPRRVDGDAGRRLVPPVVRPVLRALHVDRFVVLPVVGRVVGRGRDALPPA